MSLVRIGTHSPLSDDIHTPLSIVTETNNQMEIGNHEPTLQSSSDSLLTTPAVFDILADDCSHSSSSGDFKSIEHISNELYQASESEINAGTEHDDKNLTKVAETNTRRENSSQDTMASQNIRRYPHLTPKFLPNIPFINDQEAALLDAKRRKYAHLPWYATEKQQLQMLRKPSPLWFPERPWLRAVCTENKYYGLLCIDCIEFAKDEFHIERSSGAIICSPYWKLKHKGLEGIRKHENSNIHTTSHDARKYLRTIVSTGNIVGQLRARNMNDQTLEYLSILLKTFWFMLTHELAFMKFKAMIHLLEQVKCPTIVEWFRLTNTKQRYWSNEVIHEWVLSIDSYIYQQQLKSVRKAHYLNVIVDETRDISVQQMIAICLRYVEENTGTIKEELFKMEPITDESGEGT
ncbi:unnamed protein product [Didymodactylos carnosus]|uniref:DUF4371 domain-containing protein n=1 Tax=Didymodactylos carnosus TaxID=1234261 RepID=A0A814UTA5_9BILA|nr:unnamed protein product [Didymodactylos carnosus]CAF1181741.1 unnamed protein product [Didymodactylos carnosus]CAF3827402.1 unnamed protein product [Didymodactylos carnosus]CAF3946107.1 unnamed protein product [Didymodactylos carnosus]